MPDEIFMEISACNSCPHKYGEEPFHFPINNQRVVLVSANPSIQAMYRPMTSIRFFRRISTALFGEAGISNEAIKVFHDRIYWTHYQKCYNPDFHGKENKELSDFCYRKFLIKELDRLNPQLIIILGIPTAEKLVGGRIIRANRDIIDLQNEAFEIEYRKPAKTFVTDFPDDDKDNSRFKPIRDELVKMPEFAFMNEGLTEPLNPSGNRLSRLAVNIDFEMQALNRIVNHHNHFQKEPKTADDLWLERVIISNQNNFIKAAQIAFFIEDEVKTCLIDIFRDRSLWNIVNTRRMYHDVSSKEIQEKTIPWLIDKVGWRNVFYDYLCHIIRSNLRRVGSRIPDNLTEMIDKLKFISKMRNQIVHNGGACLPKYYYERPSKIDGIKYYVNQLLVEDAGVKNLYNFADEMMRILKEIENISLKVSH